MTPWKLELLIQKCGRWMYFADKGHLNVNPDTRLWFVPPVLTITNPDPTNPKISLEEAREVFDGLEKRHLIFPHILSVPINKEGKSSDMLVFLVNRDQAKDWEKLVSKSGFFNMKASPLMYYFFGSERPWFWLLITFICAAFFGEIFKDLGGDFYLWVKGWFAK